MQKAYTVPPLDYPLNSMTVVSPVFATRIQEGSNESRPSRLLCLTTYAIILRY